MSRWPILGTLPAEEFLHSHWQKRPLLVAAALPGLHCPFSVAELAGLACEEESDSHLCLQQADGAWEIRHGPLSEEDFLTLPAAGWLLLSGRLNRQIAELALLLDEFGFLPGWQLDHISALHAPPATTAGPWLHAHDLFLLQLAGRSDYQTGGGTAHEIDDFPLALAAGFAIGTEQMARGSLAAGDLLYLPAASAWQLQAQTPDAITLLIHCRTLAPGDLLAHYCATAIDRMDADRFHAVPDPQPAANPGEIGADVRAAMHALIRTLPQDAASIDRWFGRHVTEADDSGPPPAPETALQPPQMAAQIRRHGEIWRSEYARFAYIPDGPDGTLLYVAGREFILRGEASGRLARQLCSSRLFTQDDLAASLQDRGQLDLLTGLYNMGALYFPA